MVRTGEIPVSPSIQLMSKISKKQSFTVEEQNVPKSNKKSEWTEEEINAVKLGHEMFGPKFAQIK